MYYQDSRRRRFGRAIFVLQDHEQRPDRGQGKAARLRYPGVWL